MTKTDKLLILCICLAALLLLLVFYIWQNQAPPGNVAVIRANGEIIKEVRLDDFAGRQELNISGGLGISQLEISEHKIRFIDSPCPDKICIHRGWLEKPGDVAVCLPNKITVELKGDNPQLDAVTR